MLLKSLEMQGFKTFPDKTVLSFNSGITVVVGPNGSGKSNISDAVRWVLGEQSVKNLRCTKMEDVIFNGTLDRTAKGFAQVTLNIGNTKRRLPIDSDEVSVTRRYYRSGESEYLINKSVVRLKDVHELFMDTGLGRDGYSIIGQGKIDSIMSYNSEDRREIFEEAAGISRYKYRKIETQKKLKLAEENLVRLLDIVNELEERIEPLKEKSEKAKEYLSLVEKKKSTEIGLWLSELNEFGSILKSQNDKINIAMKQHSDTEDFLYKIENDIEVLSQKITKKNSLIDETRRKAASSGELALKSSGEISVLENDIKHNLENIDRIKLEQEEMLKNSIFIAEEIEEKKKKILGYKILEQNKSENLEKLALELENLLNDFTVFSKNHDDLYKENVLLNDQATEKRIKLMAFSSSMEDSEGKLLGINDNVKLIEENLLKEKKSFKEIESKLSNLKAEILELFNAIKNEELELEIKKRQGQELKASSEKLTFDAEDKIRKVRLLEELDRNLEGFSQSVKFVVKEGKKGNLEGIIDPISKLLRVPPEYNVAIETALGASLQHIVVESEKDAKSAILALKSKNMGRATFLPISTIKGFAIDDIELENSKGFIGIASNICNFEEKYSGVLKYLLGRVIISDTLDNATNIAKKVNYKFKVVTLDGQVINAGGSLTGGSRGENLGLVGRNSEIKILQNEANDLKEKAMKARLEFKEFHEEYLKKENHLNEINKSLMQKKNDKADLDLQHGTCLFKINSIKETLERISLEKNKLEANISSFNEKAFNEENELSEILSKIENNQAILNKINIDIEALGFKKESLNEKIQALKIELFENKKNIESIQFEINSLEDKNFNSSRKKDELNFQVDGYNKKNEEIKLIIKELKGKIENLKNFSAVSDQKIQELNLERLEVEKNIVQLRSSEKEQINEREKISLEISRLKDKKDGIQKEYDIIISSLWDEYGLTRNEAGAAFNKIEDKSSAIRVLNGLKLKIKSLGSISVDSIEEYREVSERYELMKAQVNDIEKSKKELYKMLDDLTFKMKDLFLSKFNKINEIFLHVFRELFGGGKAQLKLIEPENVLTSGIDIYVQPPGKIVTHLESLSGGEKAMVAICLYFSILNVSPSLFCFLDEIEAALDDINVTRFASYLKKMAQNTQFIAISHRRGTMEEADILYGVTMQDEGVSKVLELRSKEIAESLI